MIKRLIFDVDETLIVGVNFVDSVKNTLTKIGITSKDSVDLFLDGIKSYEKIYDNYNIKDYTKHMELAINKKLPEDFIYIFWEELKSAIPEKNEILNETIYKLSQKYELVLLTNYFAESQLNRLNNMGIGQFFKECYGENCIKPAKKAYLDACGDKAPDECVMIGDDLYLDIQRAKEEGLHTIFVNTKNISINSEIENVVNKVEEIRELLL